MTHPDIRPGEPEPVGPGPGGPGPGELAPAPVGPGPGELGLGPGGPGPGELGPGPGGPAPVGPGPGELGLGPAPAVPVRLHTRLAEQAAESGLLDVAYRTLDSPVGSLLLAATEEGLIRVAFERQDHDAALADLAARVSPRVLRAPARLETAVRQLDEYFAGRRRDFRLPLDLRLATGFRRAVVDCLPGIDYGRTRSYAEIAAAAGSPRAVRAVGTACGANPVPVVVPCHRVVRSDGSPGGYAGGPEAKRTLLELEAAA